MFPAADADHFVSVGFVPCDYVAFRDSNFFTPGQTTVADKAVHGWKRSARKLGTNYRHIGVWKAINERHNTFAYDRHNPFWLLSERAPELHQMHMREGKILA
jgi:hypothetical protein